MITFEDTLTECIKNKEFVSEFNRLTGCKLGVQRDNITKAVDDVCGYDQNKAAMPTFVEFVAEFVWIPLLMKSKETDDGG